VDADGSLFNRDTRNATEEPNVLIILHDGLNGGMEVVLIFKEGKPAVPEHLTEGGLYLFRE
jgi:hypothetical protein